VLNANPGLWWKQAAMMMCNYQTIGVEEKLQATEAALALRNPPGTELDDWARNLVGKIAVARASLAQTFYQADASLVQAHKALEYLHPDNVSYRSGATQIIGFAQYLKGDREAALQTYTESLSLAQAAGDSDAEALAFTRIGQIYEITNKLHLAHETYEHALQLLGENPQPFAAVIVLGLARIHYEWNDLEKAQELADRSYQLALRNFEVIDRLITTEMFYARLSLTRDDPAGAMRHLDEAEKQARRMDFVKRLPHIAGERALVALYQGNLEIASQLAQGCECPITKSRVLLAQGDPSAALGLLTKFHLTIEAAGDDEARLQAMVVEALVQQALGKPGQAHQVLLEALRLAEPGGFIRLFVDLGEPMRSLLKALKNQGEEEKFDLAPAVQLYLEKILAVFTVPHSPSSVSQGDLAGDLPEGLSPRELEVLRLICEGLSNQDICDRLFLALDTVKGHNRRIFEKLQVHRRTEAIARARELGLI
jgi:LuxR family maltose regulon positive regulatory protein